MTLKILLYGAPGAGKDTQAEILSKQLSIPVFLIGHMIREEVEKGTEFGKYAEPFVQSGTLVSPERITEFLKEKLMSSEVKQKGYVMNGYPRSLESLKAYLEIDRPTAVVHLIVDEALAKKRLARRGRTDDTPSLIEKKLQRYRETEMAVCEYIKENTNIPFLEIDANLSREEIAKRIIEFVGK